MKEGNAQPVFVPQTSHHEERGLHPAWREFIRFCCDMRHGEIDRLSIQDGLPVLAEITKKKVKFTRSE